MNADRLKILYEDNHLLAVSKPAGLPTMGTPGDRPTLLTLAKEYIRDRYGKPGNVYLGVVSRLDAPVTGVVLLARTSKAARRLTAQFRSHAVDKIYWVLVEGEVRSVEGSLVDWMVHDERHRRMHLATRLTPGAREARLTYRRLRRVGSDTLLEVTLETGRKHQIRLQLAEHGHPVLGDRKYGSQRVFRGGIALHARRLALLHPVKAERIELLAPLPASWRAAGVTE